jgi:hypothetical protein
LTTHDNLTKIGRDEKTTGENHYITPTYQSLLILGLDTVAKRLMDGDVVGGWEALKTLYVELPPECQKECHSDFEAIKNQLLLIAALPGVDHYDTLRRRVIVTRRYLARANFQLFDKFKQSLFAKGYLENAPTKPRNPTPITLGE